MEGCSVRPDDFITSSNENKVHIDTISSKEYLYSEANTYNDDNINYPNLGNINENGIKQELQMYKRTAICSIDNNKPSNSNICQNKTSYINEFDLFLKKYEENRNNPNDATIEPDKPIVNETVEFMDLRDKFVSLNSTKLWDNSENASSSLTFNESNEDVKDINAIINDELNADNIIASIAHSEEPFESFNIDIEFTDDVIKHKSSFEAINNLREMAETFNTKEVNSIISNNSESSQESMDEIKLDYSVNYTSISEMKLDFIDQIDDDSDCEGYNSSDFEFIDEQEAGLEGIINNSCSATQAESFKYIIDTETIYDLEKPGPSRLQYKSNKLESNKEFRVRCNNNSDDEDLNNHIIPEGEDFYELFSEPWSVYNFQAENKAFYSNKAMHFDTDIIGFNVGILHQKQKENDVDDSVKQEALENAQKIVLMYPSENNRSKRRSRLT